MARQGDCSCCSQSGGLDLGLHCSYSTRLESCIWPKPLLFVDPSSTVWSRGLTMAWAFAVTAYCSQSLSNNCWTPKQQISGKTSQIVARLMSSSGVHIRKRGYCDGWLTLFRTAAIELDGPAGASFGGSLIGRTVHRRGYQRPKFDRDAQAAGVHVSCVAGPSSHRDCPQQSAPRKPGLRPAGIPQRWHPL